MINSNGDNHDIIKDILDNPNNIYKYADVTYRNGNRISFDPWRKPNIVCTFIDKLDPDDYNNIIKYLPDKYIDHNGITNYIERIGESTDISNKVYKKLLENDKKE